MPDLQKYTDEALVKLLAEDSFAAFEEIFDRYWRQLCSAAFKRIRCLEIAEEISQDVFASLWIRRKSVVITSTLSAYLFTAVRYQVINHIQKEVVRRKFQKTLEFVTTDDNCTEETILHNDIHSRIEREISHLPSKCRSVFELSRKGLKSNKEIAVALGISEKTVENHITKALRRLRMGLAHLISLYFL